jgi:hypothetical protein
MGAVQIVDEIEVRSSVMAPAPAVANPMPPMNMSNMAQPASYQVPNQQPAQIGGNIINTSSPMPLGTPIGSMAPNNPQMMGGQAPLPMAYTGDAGMAGMGGAPSMPGYAWPAYAAHPNYAAVTYPKQYSPSAWPYIGPFYPYPQVPMGWRKVALEWDDGWWFLDFHDR